ncbi:MAG: hypothetical protein ABL974_00985 [Prosthecobacter sp.]
MKTLPAQFHHYTAVLSQKATVFLVLLLCATAGMAQSTDTDGDGMPNTWETDMGLNPSSAADKFLDKDTDGMTNFYEYVNGLNANNASDALTDKDGDRIPNLWEHDRGSQAIDAQSFPPWDAVVDASLTANLPVEKLFTNFQDAYQFLQGGAFRSIVRVKPGYYPSGLSDLGVPKKVSWIADLGAVKATLDVPAGASGFSVSDDTVIDGLVITAGFAPESYRLTDVLVSCIRHTSFTTNRRLRMATCIVRRGRHQDDNTLKADALYIENFNVELEQCTFSDNNESSTGIPSRTFGAIRRQSGALTVKNSIIEGGGYQVRYFGTTPPTIINSVIGVLTNSTVKSTVANAATLNLVGSSQYPAFTNYLGYPSGDNILQNDGVWAGTVQLVDKISTGALPFDIHGQVRPLGAGGDRGAVEWLDEDNDNLPDWWERHHFTDPNYPLIDPLRYTWSDGKAGGTNPIDGDDYNNLDEHLYALDPMVFSGVVNTPIVVDRDGDGMTDSWEEFYLGGIYASPDADPDMDGYSNLQEFLAGTKPRIHWNDTDQDGLWDTDPPGDTVLNSEQFSFESLLGVNYLLLQGYGDDYDGDRFSNGIEMNIMGTNPTAAGAVENYVWIALSLGFNYGNDPDGDGLEWAAEAALGTSPVVADSDGDGSPDGVDPSPLQPDTAAMLVKLSVAGPPVLTLFAPPGAQQEY